MMLEALAASSILLASTTGTVVETRPTWCAAAKAPVIRVGLMAPQPKSDFSKSIAQLEKFHIDTKNPYGAQVDTHVGGLTAGTIKVEQKMTIGGTRRGEESCLWVEQVNVVIRLDQKVYIAKDFKPGTCLHQAVWVHEHKHVKVDREIINKYRPLYQKAVENLTHARPVFGPIEMAREKVGQTRMMDDLSAALGRVTNAMEKEREARQQAVDSREEYDRVSASCKGK